MSVQHPVPCIILQVMSAAAPGEPPWEQPCKYELQVALERLVATEHLRGGDSATSVMFLLDGSGSVTEGMAQAGHDAATMSSVLCMDFMHGTWAQTPEMR
jgi:hypothetical protein